MILKYKIHYKFYCVVYSIIIYLLYTNTRLGRLCPNSNFSLQIQISSLVSGNNLKYINYNTSFTHRS